MTGILLAVVGNSYGYKPVNTVAPAITGTAQSRQTLTCSTGTWNAAPPSITYTYQWKRAGSNISGATSSTYVVQNADVGSTLTCDVTASNTVGSTTATSNTTATVAANVPLAPTIGTATLSGSTSASVTFTPPADNGGAAITSYTVTSSPGGITASGSSSPITVSGLSGGTSYTFTVKANNSAGSSASSSASNSITTQYSPGQSLDGGYFAAYISTSGNGVATHALIVSPKASGQTTGKNISTGITPTSFINGPANSYDLGVTYSATAATFCEGLTINGYSDWYLPAKSEADAAYVNLKPSSISNDTSSGINDYSVPKRTSNYTTSSPTTTTATAFQSGNSESIDTTYIWTSTATSGTQGYVLYFANGYSFAIARNSNEAVRAFRRKAL